MVLAAAAAEEQGLGRGSGCNVVLAAGPGSGVAIWPECGPGSSKSSVCGVDWQHEEQGLWRGYGQNVVLAAAGAGSVAWIRLVLAAAGPGSVTWIRPDCGSHWAPIILVGAVPAELLLISMKTAT